MHDPFRPALAHGRVRFVGEPVAIIVAETEYLAQDAAELIEIEYEDLPVLVEAADAFSDKAATLHDGVPNNLAFDYVYGDADKTEKAFAEAAHVVKAELRAQRISGNPMEPKSCLARYDAAKDTYEVWLPSQGVSDLKNSLAQMTGLDRDRFVLHSEDVGGGFGVRNEIYPEFPAVMLAAKKAGRPVKWTGTRSETLSGDHHGRAADLRGELALDASGRFLGLRVQWLVNLGAYCSGAGPLINTVAAPTSSAISLYDVPALYGRHRLVFTNTTPTTAYRGAGRPNVAYLVGAAGREGRGDARHGFDPASPPQSHQGQAVSVQDADRLVLRQRRSGRPARHRAGARRLEVVREAAPRRQEAGPAARHRSCAVPRAVRRRRQGGDQDQDHSRRPPRAVFAGRPVRPGPRDGVPRSGRRHPRASPPSASSFATTTSPRPSSPAPEASARAR